MMSHCFPAADKSNYTIRVDVTTSMQQLLPATFYTRAQNMGLEKQKIEIETSAGVINKRIVKQIVYTHTTRENVLLTNTHSAELFLSRIEGERDSLPC